MSDTELKVDPEEWEFMEIVKEEDSDSETKWEPPKKQQRPQLRSKEGVMMGKSKSAILRANMPEDKRQFQRKKDMWRRRIERGHPSVTEEKIKELKEKYGIVNFKKLTAEQLEKQRAAYRISNKKSETSEKKEKKMWRQRIKRGTHPSLTEEKLKELKDNYGLDISKIRKMTPEEKQQANARVAEQKRMKLAKMKEQKKVIKMDKDSESETEEQGVAEMSEDKWKLEKEKSMWRKRIKRGHPSVTEEKLKELEQKYGLHMSKLTPEELEEDRKKRAEYEKIRRQNLQDQERYEERQQKKRFRNLEKRLLMTEEEKQERRIKNYFSNQAYRAKRGKYSAEPREVKDKQNEWYKNYVKSLTGEKRKRWLESVKRSHFKLMEKWKVEQPEKWKQYQEKRREYMKIRYHNESEEERKKRRYKDKVNGVKRKLRKQLEEEGVAKQEIEERLKLVHEQMWKEFDPEWSWETYGKGRGRRRRAVEHHEETSQSCGGASLQQESSLRFADFEDAESVYQSEESKTEPFSMTLNTEECVAEWMENEPSSPSPPASPASPAAADLDEEETHSNEIKFQQPPLSYPCSHCVLEFNDDTDLRCHLRSSHSDRIWTCPKCIEVVLSPQDLALHFQSLHKAKSDPQKGESVSVSTKVESVKKNAQQPSLNFFCMRCPLRTNLPVGFESRSELFAHVRLKHKRHFWPCEHCQLLKYSKPALELHLTMCRLSK